MKLLHLGKRDALTVHVIYDGTGRLVHRSIVSKKDFRYPFMSTTDLMIGGLWTDPELRGRGLATWTVAEILRRAEEQGCRGWLWYVVADDNASSIRVAVGNHFQLTGSGKKTRRFGVYKLGVFVPRNAPAPNFASLTEQWGMPMPDEQVAMAGRRYYWLAENAAGKRMLEIGCGSGIGLGFAGRKASLAVGGDVAEDNLRSAKRALPDARVLLMDGHQLPFADNSFDVAAAFEVLYYMADPSRALEEIRRVLSDGGTLLLCLPNPDRPGFHASPHSFQYFSGPELVGLLEKAGFHPELYGGFPIGSGGMREHLVVSLTTLAIRLQLVPRSLSGRSRVKRLIYGNLHPLEGLTDETPRGESLVRLDPNRPTGRFKNLYAIGRVSN